MSTRRRKRGCKNIDYRCIDGRFWVPASWVTISNPNSLSRSETGVNPGIRSWKKRSSEWAWCQKAIGGISFTKKWRTETLRPGLQFADFKPQLESRIFKCISWLNGSFFLWGEDLRFLKEGVKTCLMAFFLSSHLWSMSEKSEMSLTRQSRRTTTPRWALFNRICIAHEQSNHKTPNGRFKRVQTPTRMSGAECDRTWGQSDTTKTPCDLNFKSPQATQNIL